MQKPIQTNFRPQNIIGNLNAARVLFLHIAQPAGIATTVVIRGESGADKEWVARAIHEQSPRVGWGDGSLHEFR